MKDIDGHKQLALENYQLKYEEAEDPRRSNRRRFSRRRLADPDVAPSHMSQFLARQAARAADRRLRIRRPRHNNN